MSRPRPGSASGSAALEVVLLVPLLILLAGFVVAVGRVELARTQVDAVAAQAALAAADTANPTTAPAAAEQAAAAALAAGDLSCAHQSVRVDLADYRPGGVVAVAVSCVAELPDLPGTQTLTARATAVIDSYRAVGG